MIKATAELLACTEAHSVLLADAEAVAAAERVGLLLRLTTPLPGDEPTQLLIPKAVFSSIEQDGIKACAASPTQPGEAQLLRRRVQSLRDRKLLSLIGEKEQATAAQLPALLDCRPQLLVLCGKRATLNAIPRTEGLTRGLLTRDGSVVWLPLAAANAGDPPAPASASLGTSRVSQPTRQSSQEWTISPEMAELLRGAQLVIDESALLHPLMPKLMAQLEASIRKGETKLRTPAACRLALTHAKELALYEKRMQLWKPLIAVRGGEHQEVAALLAQMQCSLQGTRMVVLSQKPEGLACARRLGMACVCFAEKGLLRLCNGGSTAPNASAEAAKPALQQMSPAPTQAQHGTNEGGLKVLKRRGLEVCLRLPLKPEKLREHLKGCQVYIDTCSLLHPSAPLLIELLAGLHREGVLRLAIPFCCLQELGRKMQEDSDLLKRGVNVMLLTFREDDGGLVYPKVPLKSGEPADNVLQVSMMQERIASDVALVTQDGDLQNDVLGLNEQESVKKAAHRVRVFRLEKPQKTDYLAELRRASDKP